MNRFGGLSVGRQRDVFAQESEQVILIPPRPREISVRLVMMNFGTAHAVVDAQEKLYVEGLVVLAGLR